VTIHLPQFTAPEKPREGEPCNGCGFCCAAETCKVARSLLNAYEAPCPAMEFDAGRFWCGLVRDPAKYLGAPAWGNDLLRPTVERVLGVGRGCDATDPG
jgi:hypothetical protein